MKGAWGCWRPGVGKGCWWGGECQVCDVKARARGEWMSQSHKPLSLKCLPNQYGEITATGVREGLPSRKYISEGNFVTTPTHTFLNYFLRFLRGGVFCFLNCWFSEVPKTRSIWDVIYFFHCELLGNFVIHLCT